MKAEDENGRLLKIYDEETGEPVWKDKDYVQRPKISDKSKQEMIDAIQNQNWEKLAKIQFEILTGQTIKEATQ